MIYCLTMCLTSRVFC